MTTNEKKLRNDMTVVNDTIDVRVGERLREARLNRGWSLNHLEAETEGEFKASIVGAYERGERTISVSRLVVLSGIYGTTSSTVLTELNTEPEICPECGQVVR